MQRLIITGPRQAEFEDAPEPRCAVDGLLVRAKVTAVSPGTETRVYRALPVDDAGGFLHERVPFELPAENGYSMVGDVIAVGDDVRGFATGDRVFVPATHKQVAAIPANLAVRLPEAVADEQAVFLNILEVAHIGLRRGRPGPGECVAVVGLGVIGLSAVAFCRAFGLCTVAVDPNRRRLAAASKMGAELCVSPDDDRFRETVAEFTGGGCDVVLEATSNWAGVRTAMELARPEGTVVVISRHIQTPDFNPVGHPFLGRKLTLLTSYGYPPDGDRWDRERSTALAVKLLGEGRIDVGPMITDRLDRRQLPSLYERYDSGDAELIGAVLNWT
ncbi:MAG: zinc-binding dehydrogenase [Planctomycetaceae bacterium]